MDSIKTLPEALALMFRTLSRGRRRQGVFTLILMALGAGAEMLGISAVFVFLTVLTDPRRLTSRGIWRTLQANVPHHLDPLAVAVVAFVAVVLFSTLIRLALTWLTNSFSINAGFDLSSRAFRKVTTQPYSFYLDTSSDQILSRIEKIYLTNGVLLAGVQAVVASFLSTLIIVFLLLLDFKIAITLGSVLVGSYVAASILARSSLSRNSELVAAAHVDRFKRIQEALGGIRDILVDRSQWVFQADFEHSGDRARRPQVFNLFVQNAPRVAIEAIGMFAIAAVALTVARDHGGLIRALPILGGLAIGAQRLLPLLQQAYNGWSMFLGHRKILIEIAGLLNLPDAAPAAAHVGTFHFKTKIKLEYVSFAYSEARPVLTDVNLMIGKGERVGIIGTTGSGKSTLTDLLLGLLTPTAGKIFIDNEVLDRESLASWQAQVAHVPQSIYLSDDTVARNIAFGVHADQLDSALVESAARSAGLHDFIASLPDRYDTRCGERGVRLSGGQRQRIGIARALYKRARVMILDEATSALDNETEQAVMQSISELSSDITIIMIAHRLSSLSQCGRIFRVGEGRVTEVPLADLDIPLASAPRAIKTRISPSQAG
jgi:ABC-type multidrug transport system fused ATPase/permease subunit